MVGECALVAHPIGDHRHLPLVRDPCDLAERRVYKQIEAEEREKAGLPPKQQPPAATEPGSVEEPPQ